MRIFIYALCILLAACATTNIQPNNDGCGCAETVISDGQTRIKASWSEAVWGPGSEKHPCRYGLSLEFLDANGKTEKMLYASYSHIEIGDNGSLLLFQPREGWKVAFVPHQGDSCHLLNPRDYADTAYAFHELWQTACSHNIKDESSLRSFLQRETISRFKNLKRH